MRSNSLQPKQTTFSTPKAFPLLKQVWRLAWPGLLTNLLQSLVNVVDVYMVGRLGPISIAAVGMGTAIRFLVMTMMLSVSTGAMSLMAQAKGARDPERMSFVTRQAISSGLLLSLVLMVVGYALAHPLMSLVRGFLPWYVEYHVE